MALFADKEIPEHVEIVLILIYMRYRYFSVIHMIMP